MEKVLVNLYWIRHAFSCANLLQKKGIIANLARPIITIDPALTTVGVKQSMALNEAFVDGRIDNTFDIVLCSNLRRAMETAMYAFNKVNTLIYVVPYISEARNPYASALNIDKENAPLTADELEKYYLSIADQFDVKVNFDILKELDRDGKLAPNYDNFIKISLPKVLALLPENNGYSIAIVSHSHFIKQHLSKKYPNISEVKNTEMWVERLELSIVKCIDKYKQLPFENCKKGICRVYEGKTAPSNITNDERCHELQKSKLYSMALGKNKKNTIISKGGNDNHEKYIKYKTKYLLLKNEQNNQI